jgi:hypothetical protein
MGRKVSRAHIFVFPKEKFTEVMFYGLRLLNCRVGVVANACTRVTGVNLCHRIEGVCRRDAESSKPTALTRFTGVKSFSRQQVVKLLSNKDARR